MSESSEQAVRQPPRTPSRSMAQDGLGDFLRSARVNWWLVLLMFSGATAGVTAWTVRQPRIFEATCTIEFDPNPPRPLGNDIDDVASPMANFWMSREFFATQERVMSSRVVAERVVQRLGLQRQRSFLFEPTMVSSSWEGMSVTEAAAMLQGRISIEDVQGTRLVLLHVRDTDPERAALIANTIAEVYIEKTLEDRLGSTVTALEWLGEQLDSLRGQLEGSELALHSFKIEHNVLSVSLEDRQNLVAQEIERFSTALTETRTQRIGLQARVARLRTLLSDDDVEAQASALIDVETLQGLREALREKLAEQDGLEERYGPNHPRMQELRAQIEALRSQLRGELSGMMRAAEADVRQAVVTEGGLRSALDQAQQAGLDLNMREIEYTRLSRERDNNEKLYEVVLQRTTEADVTRALRTTFVRMVDRALPPGGYVSPRVPLNIGVGAAFGLSIGLLLAFILGRLDSRIRSVEEFEEYGAIVLGVLPTMDEARERAGQRARRRGRDDVSDAGRDLVTHHQPLSSIAENFRTIRTNLVFMTGDSERKVIAVTSANPREGKTLIVANLAISLAQSGKKVLVIDTDLRRPRVHRAFGLKNIGGVTPVIAGQLAFADAVQSSSVPGVDVLSSGPIPPNPAELLHRESFKQMLVDARNRYDVVLFDSPPLGAVIDAAVLGPQVDGVIVVARPGETTRHAVRAMLRQLQDVGAHIIGAIVNGVDPRGQAGYYSGARYYYYRRDKGYYASDTDDAEPMPGASNDGGQERPGADA